MDQSASSNHPHPHPHAFTPPPDCSPPPSSQPRDFTRRNGYERQAVLPQQRRDPPPPPPPSLLINKTVAKGPTSRGARLALAAAAAAVASSQLAPPPSATPDRRPKNNTRPSSGVAPPSSSPSSPCATPPLLSSQRNRPPPVSVSSSPHLSTQKEPGSRGARLAIAAKAHVDSSPLPPPPKDRRPKKRRPSPCGVAPSFPPPLPSPRTPHQPFSQSTMSPSSTPCSRLSAEPCSPCRSSPPTSDPAQHQFKDSWHSGPYIAIHSSSVVERQQEAWGPGPACARLPVDLGWYPNHDPDHSLFYPMSASVSSPSPSPSTSFEEDEVVGQRSKKKRGDECGPCTVWWNNGTIPFRYFDEEEHINTGEHKTAVRSEVYPNVQRISEEGCDQDAAMRERYFGHVWAYIDSTREDHEEEEEEGALDPSPPTPPGKTCTTTTTSPTTTTTALAIALTIDNNDGTTGQLDKTGGVDGPNVLIVSSSSIAPPPAHHHHPHPPPPLSLCPLQSPSSGGHYHLLCNPCTCTCPRPSSTSQSEEGPRLCAGYCHRGQWQESHGAARGDMGVVLLNEQRPGLSSFPSLSDRDPIRSSLFPSSTGIAPFPEGDPVTSPFPLTPTNRAPECPSQSPPPSPPPCPCPALQSPLRPEPEPVTAASSQVDPARQNGTSEHSMGPEVIKSVSDRHHTDEDDIVLLLSQASSNVSGGYAAQ